MTEEEGRNEKIRKGGAAKGKERQIHFIVHVLRVLLLKQAWHSFLKEMSCIGQDSNRKYILYVQRGKGRFICLTFMAGENEIGGNTGGVGTATMRI